MIYYCIHNMSKRKSALLVIDLQNDFCTGGAIEVPNFLNIIPIINRIKSKFDVVIFSKDWHPSDHSSFIKQGGKWPPHCVQFTNGADIHPAVDINKDKDFIIHKGTDANYDSYSAFYNSKEIGSRSQLHRLLEEHNINNLFVCGIAAEYCVYSTLLDAVKDVYLSYKCYLIKDATIGLDEDKIQKCYTHLQKLGVKIIKADDIN